MRALAIALATTIVGLAGTSVYRFIIDSSGDSNPVAFTLEPLAGLDCEGFVFNSPQKSDFPTRDRLTTQWALSHGGATYNKVKWSLTLKGKRNHFVVLQSMRIIEYKRGRPVAQPVIVSKCPVEGGDFAARSFEISLRDKATIKAVPGLNPGTGEVLEPAVTFPYKVSETDAEVFYLDTDGEPCTCSYKISIVWSDGDRSGELIVDRASTPFNTSIADNEKFVEWLPSNEWKSAY